MSRNTSIFGRVDYMDTHRKIIHQIFKDLNTVYVILFPVLLNTNFLLGFSLLMCRQTVCDHELAPVGPLFFTLLSFCPHIVLQLPAVRLLRDQTQTLSVKVNQACVVFHFHHLCVCVFFNFLVSFVYTISMRLVDINLFILSLNSSDCI